VDQIRYITARRSGKSKYIESEFQKHPLRDTGVWGKHNDGKDRWIAVGPDDRRKNYVQIGDWSSHWPGRYHGGFPSWGSKDNGYKNYPWHSQVVVIHPCNHKVDADDRWYNYQEWNTTCSYYRSKYCAGGKPKPQFIHLFGEYYNFPEHHCYDCGRNIMSTHLNANPSTHINKCVHDPAQGRSKFIMDHCAA
jgi:hypothetical protein